MRNTHNRNGAQLAHWIIFFYTQELGTCFANTGILVRLSFFLRFLKPSLLNLIQSQVNNQGTLLFRFN